MDVIYVALILLFGGLALGLLQGCRRLEEPRRER